MDLDNNLILKNKITIDRDFALGLVGLKVDVRVFEDMQGDNEHRVVLIFDEISDEGLDLFGAELE